MDSFPFSQSEWTAVKEAARPVVNACLADDDVLNASHLVRLLEVLAGLRSRYGAHPILLETEADFTEDDLRRTKLYRRAATIADAHGLPTLSIRLSLVPLLLEAGNADAARSELQACAGEVHSADESDRRSWGDLVAVSNRSVRTD